MTKKDYIKLAAALKILPRYALTTSNDWVRREDVIAAIADVLQADNPSFDRDRFETAARG